MTASLARRAAAEAAGSCLPVTAVVGSGIQATELSRDVGVQLLANSLVTVFALGAVRPVRDEIQRRVRTLVHEIA